MSSQSGRGHGWRGRGGGGGSSVWHATPTLPHTHTTMMPLPPSHTPLDPPPLKHSLHILVTILLTCTPLIIHFTSWSPYSSHASHSSLTVTYVLTHPTTWHSLPTAQRPPPYTHTSPPHTSPPHTPPHTQPHASPPPHRQYWLPVSYLAPGHCPPPCPAGSAAVCARCATAASRLSCQ